MNNQHHASIIDLGLFSGSPQHQNFCRVKDLMPTRDMPAASTPRPWPVGPELQLPDKYEFDGEMRAVEDFLVDTDTAALLVVIDGEIRYERYLLTGGVEVPWLSMSLAKSFISALVGIAVADGHIRSADDPISDYVPVEPGSAYDGVSIKDVLRMSSGARWNEDYSDPGSDIIQLALTLSTAGGSLDDFVARMAPQTAPGTVCRYNSGETQVLGALLARATGRSVSTYMHEKLVEPLGFESAGCWILDPADTELSFAGLNLTLRDYARLGELYRNGGAWNGQQIVPAAWVYDSVTVGEAHLGPGSVIVGDGPTELGYGYQWWIPAGDRGEFAAIGVYNQFVYVDPPSGTTIVKLSANHRYGTTSDEATNREQETLAVLRTIARSPHSPGLPSSTVEVTS
jgi:CubicO group peptidase (beta-lactamase class C family)